MIRNTIDRCVETVTAHHHIVVVVMLLVTAGMIVGITNAEIGDEEGIGGSIETPVEQREQYIQEQYGQQQADDESLARAPAYVYAEDGNALSKDALLTTLEYQEAITDDERVDESLADEGVLSVAGLVGERAAEDPDATLDEQRAALEELDDDEVAALVEETISEDQRAGLLVPDSYEPGTASAESHQLIVVFESDDPEPPSDAQQALYDAAADHDDPEIFTLGEHAGEDLASTNVENTLFLIVPIVLGLIFVVAALTYRDPVDVLVGVTGVFVSIIWMFGLLGWAGIPVGASAVIGPVLIAGLSIDYGFHVFMRYREQRGPDEPIVPPMRRGVRSLALALGLVTITASIGFLSNVFNPVPELRELAVGITLGVVAAFIVFVTLVPALKLSVDRLLERVGIDRRKEPLGHGAYIEPLLNGTVALARRAAPAVIAIALITAAAGGVAWTALDEEAGQGPDGDVAEWKQDLPGPVGWEENEVIQNQEYVSDEFRTASDSEGDRVQFLVEGDIASDGALTAVDDGIESGFETGAFAEQRADMIQSPVTVIQTVAAEDDEFAETVAAADTSGDGIPDSNLESVYDHLFEVAPEAATQVIERTDGEYESLRVIGPPEGTSGIAPGDDEADELFAVADEMEAETDDDLTATPVAGVTEQQQTLETITDGILQVMVVGVAAVFVALSLIYRRVHDSATLGAVTAGPIALVLGFVVGGMALLDIPLTFLTALLISLVIGIGVDYNIHISDRFAQELERGNDSISALSTAVTGTGGALFGSMLTSVAAFAGMLIHPQPDFTHFAWLVVLALLGAFVTSVIVLPSLLYVWARHVGSIELREASQIQTPPAETGDD
ncbi:MMPL family transporter [Natronorubrum sp. JWXQ-INN-674]|uniref:MMPL family transporter n=1 Tax=Natronorubrum halalkaliphilum TaxID=2691917 RepID=A0A6B0VSB1_9EURY|nr:MMPL family transporter [Natronorubrum halalkaliphilum]MXV63937.1 MMPL family transporter [Natronorubrum halalkaliphilum]